MDKFLKKVLLEEVTVENCREIVQEIVFNIRSGDREEIECCGINDLAAALADSVKTSAVCYVALNEQRKPLCVFGVSSVAHPELGRPVWLIGSKLMFQYTREFVVHGRLIIDRWLEQYGQLYNFVKEDNSASIRWLKSVGATFYEPISYGEGGERFALFIIESGKGR